MRHTKLTFLAVLLTATVAFGASGLTAGKVELKSAGATVVDPIVIPDLDELQKTGTVRPEDEALKVWLAVRQNGSLEGNNTA